MSAIFVAQFAEAIEKREFYVRTQRDWVFID